ncbi:MAG: hypothetical protein M3O01_06205 [Pseudomonadota bacterium]|nr:hypothetical protein [Pseudomonadota bacterium]
MTHACAAWLRRLRMACWVLLAWGLPHLDVQAQTLDDVRLQTQGDDVVARISFNARVRFLEQMPASEASLFRLTFDLVAADDSVINQVTQESKHLPAERGVPDLTLTYAPSKLGRVRELVLQLAAPALVRARQGPASSSIDIVFVGAGRTPGRAAPEPAAGVEPAPVQGLPEVEKRAAELLVKAREALAARRNDEAVQTLNQLLLLPPNSASQEAQEFIGLAWERVGDLERAKTEYRLYLKLYPQGEGSQRVAQRLASIGGGSTPEAGKPLAEGTTRPAAETHRFSGNIAQYYYGGKARSQSLVNIAAGIDQSTLTQTTESAIVTSVDLGGRYVGADSETRVVVRGTGSVNLQANSHSDSLLNAAYVDYKRNDSGLAVRLGRQSAISGGLLGLFDGVSVTYPFAPGWKADVMGGVPANTLVSGRSERLLAAMVEADGILDHWGGDFYLVDQTSEGIANRRAVGTELRYSDERLSAYTLLDYDVLFRKLNAATFQGSYQFPAQTTLTVLFDSRTAPSLELTNALISSGAASLKDLLKLESLDEARAAALATTARAKQTLISLSRPLNEKWQVAVDLRYTSIGALPAVGNFDATPSTGGQYGSTLQLTGSNLYSTRDINNFNVSVLSTPIFKGVQLAYNNLTGLRNNDVTLEPSLRFYQQHDNQGVKVSRVTPGLRMTYKLSRRASVLGESVVEHSKTDGPTNHDTTNSIFFYVGYRYELF